MDAAIAETAEVLAMADGEDQGDSEDVSVDYVTIRIPLKRIKGMPTVSTQRCQWTARQARTQRLIYDGMHYTGASLRGVTTRAIGTTAPLWHATAWLLDQVADAAGIDPSSWDTLA